MLVLDVPAKIARKAHCSKNTRCIERYCLGCECIEKYCLGCELCTNYDNFEYFPAVLSNH